MPSILGLTGEAFAEAFKRSVRDGTSGALRAYGRFYREGVWGVEGVDGPRVGAVGKVLTSESDEGVVLKFTQRVPRAVGLVAGAGASAAPGVVGVAGGSRSVSLTVAGQEAVGSAEMETESVLIPMVGKKRERSYTLCVSSQVGCAMGCTFCQTAQMGLVRSLTAAEIVQQWFAAQHLVQRPDPEAEIRNVVFMGMGEPLDNFDAVAQAIEVLTDRRGPGIAASRITVSTVGRIDGLVKLRRFVSRDGFRRVGLAISVNAPTDAVRSGIMPINRSMPMGKLREAIIDWPRCGSSYIMAEYVLIPGVNDSDEQARELAAWVNGDAGEALRCCVNVIPYNPREKSPWPAPDEATVERFVTTLAATGVYVKRRRTKGRDQMAACGQLGNLEYKRKRG